uniref:Uncharacterized protein n=1 Tax=Anopheles christyi TaxID=43041 RepID=A0A182JVJ9_9DIPT
MSLLARTDIDAGGFFVNFNQDCSSLAVGSKNGYSLFSLNSVDSNLDQIYTSIGEDICLVERLFSSSLVAVVSLNAPRKLKVCHFKKGTEICNYSYSNTILAVKLNRSRLVVCLEESLYIHNIRDMKVVHTIRDTPPNKTGLCALASDSDHCYLAYPGSATVGEVQIFDAVNLHAKIMIPAHDSPLAAIAFSQIGTEIATASEKGTVIRVFSVSDGSKLFEFRRGVKRCVSIASLAFSTCSKYLCCSSNTETVHVFKLERVSPETTEEQGAAEAWYGKISKAFTNYLPLPTQVTDVFSQGRAFAAALLPVPGLRHSCVITTIQKALRMLVASQDGYLYVYQIPTEGGECQLIKKHDLRNIELPPNPPRSESVPIGVPTVVPSGGSSYAATVRGTAGSSTGSGGGAGSAEDEHHDQQQQQQYSDRFNAKSKRFPAPRVLALHPMAKASIGAPSTPYSVRTMNYRRWQYVEKPASYFRSLHRSESQTSLKTVSSLRSSKSVEAPKADYQANNPSEKLSLVQTLRSMQWNNFQTHLTASSALQFVRNLPSSSMAAYTMVIESREYELVRHMLVTACQLTVRISKTAYLWLGLFLESREYFYLRYYTLLALEQTIVWLRYGLRTTFDLIRKWTEKK